MGRIIVVVAFVGSALAVAPSLVAQEPSSLPTTQPAVADSAYTAPAATEQDGWLVYQEAPTYSASEVAGLAPGQGTPEAAVVHYMASRVRGDQRHLEVLVPEPERDGRLQRGLAEHDGWTFTAFRLDRRQIAPPEGDAEIWFKVYFEIQFGGHSDSGTDDFGLMRRGGLWFITSVPT